MIRYLVHWTTAARGLLATDLVILTLETLAICQALDDLVEFNVNLLVLSDSLSVLSALQNFSIKPHKVHVLLCVRREVTSRLYEMFRPSLSLPSLNFKILTVGPFILELHLVRAWSRVGLLVVSKVAGVMSKTRLRNILRVQVFLEHVDHIHKETDSQLCGGIRCTALGRYDARYAEALKGPQIGLKESKRIWK
ncbi:hypothetical protein TNCV_3474361 [Trichonephila clavipes]|nr:hypothetical protein TNCV_3474361 [Trichonephila clavipes]